MMDDTFFLQPVTREQLAISRAARQINIQREIRFESLSDVEGSDGKTAGPQRLSSGTISGTHGPLLIENKSWPICSRSSIRWLSCLSGTSPIQTSTGNALLRCESG